MMRSAVVVCCCAALLTACGEGSAPSAEKSAAPAAAKGSATPAAEAAATPTPAAVTDKAEAKRLAHDRHENFEKIGKAYKAINDQLKESRPDVARISENAREINRFAPQIAGWFPAGTGPQDGIRTHALATVWSEPERFRQASASMVTAAAALETSARRGEVKEIRASAKTLGESCKGCHDRFREKEH